MNKRIELTNIGGFPFTQDTLKFMQDSYRGAFGGLAGMIGDKTIVTGVEVSGSNVTNGWIIYQGELIPFVGGVLGADVIISETSVDADFEDGSTFPTYFTKVAISGAGGAFPFSDLIRLSALQNIWLPGDIKEKYCDAAYIAANFDVDGYGLNREKGWRILSKAYPAAAGKMMVNLDSADTDFDTCGKNGGAKEVTLTTAQMPGHRHKVFADNQGTSGGVPYSLNRTDNISIAGANRAGGLLTTNGNGTNLIESVGGGQAHPNMPPYFVVLKLIKL